ncbi:hypothetical protein CPB85DRAFT_473633 [Mucidula mucida]|nr:hypothetical protein CPB85DRAFT_473633 [Mucidula mucida]
MSTTTSRATMEMCLLFYPPLLLTSTSPSDEPSTDLPIRSVCSVSDRSTSYGWELCIPPATLWRVIWETWTPAKPVPSRYIFPNSPGEHVYKPIADRRQRVEHHTVFCGDGLVDMLLAGKTLGTGARTLMTSSSVTPGDVAPSLEEALEDGLRSHGTFLHWRRLFPHLIDIVHAEPDNVLPLPSYRLCPPSYIQYSYIKISTLLPVERTR